MPDHHVYCRVARSLSLHSKLTPRELGAGTFAGALLGFGSALVALAAFSAQAQPVGSALDSCRAYAKREFARDGATFKDIVLDGGRHLLVERYGRKLGNQLVSTIVSGHGAVVYDGIPSVELQFACLLADEKRAIFFHWAPRADPSPLTQCTRAGGDVESARACLQNLLALEEADLSRSAALRFQETREADVAARDERASAAFRQAAEAWRAYRDAECARRTGAEPSAANSETIRLSCVVELTRQRGQDLRQTP